jgi:serine/threonine protein kinase
MKGGCLAENQAKRVLLQIIEGFTYLYEKKIIHRDCKLENILINFPDRDGGKEIPWEEIDLDKEKFEIKIADFGYARRLEHG